MVVETETTTVQRREHGVRQKTVSVLDVHREDVYTGLIVSWWLAKVFTSYGTDLILEGDRDS